jgi:hypothetical protein
LGALRTGNPWIVSGNRSFATTPPGDDSPADPIHNKHLEAVFSQNAEWQDGKLKEDPEYFKKLGSGHSPRYVLMML